MKLRRNLNNSEEGFKAQQTCPQSHISSNQKQGWGGDIRLFLVGGMVVLWSSRDAAFMSHITQAEVRRKAFQRCSSLSLNSLIHQAGLEWMFFYGLSSVPWCESGVNRCLFMSPQEVLQYYCLTVDGRLWDPERVCRIQQSFRGVYLQLSHIGGGIISHREWLWLTLSFSPLSPSGQWTQCVRDVCSKTQAAWWWGFDSLIAAQPLFWLPTVWFLFYSGKISTFFRTFGFLWLCKFI